MGSQAWNEPLGETLFQTLLRLPWAPLVGAGQALSCTRPWFQASCPFHVWVNVVPEYSRDPGWGSRVNVASPYS